MALRKAGIVLFGPPGSGKTTLSDSLMQYKGVEALITGRLLRREVKKGNAQGRKIKAYLSAGDFVPTELVVKVMAAVLKKSPAGTLLFDGFPRTTGQLNPFFAMVEQYKVDLSAIFILSVSHTITLKRLTGRLSCPQCGAIYNTYFNPPQKGEICDRCGARLRRRRDDRLGTINKRVLEYEDQTVPVIKYFRNHHPNITYELNGEREQADITESVLSVLGGRGVLLDDWREDSKGTESSQSTDE